MEEKKRITRQREYRKRRKKARTKFRVLLIALFAAAAALKHRNGETTKASLTVRPLQTVQNRDNMSPCQAVLRVT
jgi:hypothetical protein